MNRLFGKVAVVTGAAGGLGKAISILLAEEGSKVVLTDVDDVSGASLASELSAAGFNVSYMHLDVTSEAQWEYLMRYVDDKFGCLNILVNNAGTALKPAFVTDTSLEDWRHLMSINLDGVFLGTKYAVELMRKSIPVNGSIVNISSAAGMVGVAGRAPYCASKGGVRLHTKSVALSCSQLKLAIRINSIHPGFIDTPLLRQVRADSPEGTNADVDSIFAAPIGTPLDVAYGVVYLASDESKFVNGTELVIDGGYTAG